MNNKLHESTDRDTEKFQLFAIPRFKAIREKHYRKMHKHIKSVRGNEYLRTHLSRLNQFVALYPRELNKYLSRVIQ